MQDSRQRPLRPERTCGHLEVGAAGQAGRFYARCALGTAADRARWAAAQGGPQPATPEEPEDISADVSGAPQRRTRAPR